MMLTTRSPAASVRSRPDGRPACLVRPRGLLDAARSRKTLYVCNLMSQTSSNPAFTFGKVDEAISETGRGRGTDVMTVDGAVTKTALLLAVAMATGSYTWMQIFSGKAALAMAALSASKVAGIVAMGAALATMFKPHWAMTTGLIFSAAKGVALGGLTAVLEVQYPGLVMNATMLTFGTAASMLAAFKMGLIKVTDKFRDGLMMCTGGYMVLMLGTWLLSLCGLKLPSLLTAGPVGIAVSLAAVGLASANLLLDFDMIRSAAYQRLPKWMEWYSGFSLMVTLVWMYTEIIRLLLAFARGRDD